MKKVAIYIRLSKEDMKKIDLGDDSESIKNQKLMLSEYTATKGFQLYDFYVDEDYSGADRHRPDFDRLLKDAKNKEFDIVLCKTQNRFVRDLEAVEEIIHGKFLKWNIRFISLLDGADTADINNKKSRQIHGMVDEWYLEDLSKNIRQVFKSKMEDGQFLGAFAPYGYMKDLNNRHQLVIDSEAAVVVRKIYNLYLKGNGTHLIAKTLTAQGIPKPAVHMKKTHGKNFSVPNISDYGMWGHTTINRILRNPVYIGVLIQGKETTLSYKDKKRISVDPDDWISVEDTHTAIVSKEDYYEVQRLMDSKRRNVGKKGKTHIFATKVRCLHCGGSMVRSTTRSRKYSDLTYSYLKCKHNTVGGDLICEYKNRINYTDLYESIESEFLRLIEMYKSNSEALELTYKQIRRVDHVLESRKLISKVKTVESELVDKGKILTDLYIDKTKGIVSEDDYGTISFTLKEERIQLELRKSDIEKKIDEIKKLETENSDVKKMINDYLNNVNLSHEIVVEAIDYIEIGKDLSNKSGIINIYWKL